MGDPTILSALPSSSANGERLPLSFGAVITPTSWISTSLSPTLEVPGARGAWTFSLSDLSGGKSTFGTKTYAESGTRSRIPLGAGLQQGNVYTWTATSPGQAPVAGSFQVDVQQNSVQQFDGGGGVSVGLSSGEASFVWSSHSVASLPGSVGFGLQFQASNADQPGVPSGWNLQAASSSPYRSVEIREDGTIALQSLNGAITLFQEGASGVLLPVRTGVGSSVDTSGLAPVLVRVSETSFSVTTKSSTSLFTLEPDSNIAYLSDVSSSDSPLLEQRWTGGRLQSITDPVSGRVVRFTYGGSDCPKPAPGFIGTPVGVLCKVDFWDGSTSSIFYVDTPNGPTIGRFVDFPEAGANGAQVADLGWDAAGRIARTRTPLVAMAAASDVVGQDDPQFWAEIAYSPEGKVASITDQAALSGATRCSRSYVYQDAFTEVNDSCFGGVVSTLAFDPTTYFPLHVTNAQGQTSTNTWDLASGLLLSSVDYQGLVSTYHYENGNMATSTGPTRGPLTEASTTLYTYDQQFTASMDAIEMRGLDVSYSALSTADSKNVESIQELGPRLGGIVLPALTANWSSAPIGDSGWAATMTGTLMVKQGGDYRIESANSTARVIVNNVSCSDGGCASLPLTEGGNSIRIDVRSPSPQASMDVVWSGPDTGGAVQAIPTSSLRPGYGYATTTKSVDPTAQRAPIERSTQSVYVNPAKGQLDSRVNQAGLRTSLTYEDANGGRGGWSRQNSSVGADGAQYRFTYWGDRESAKPACPGAKSVNQGGSARDVVSPLTDVSQSDPSTQWVDASGHVVAISIPGGVLKCFTYGPDGQMTSVQLLNTGTTWKVDLTRSIVGGALRSTSVETHGDQTATTWREIDLIGRTLVSVDRFGVETRTTYDTRTGEVATKTVTAPGAAPVVIGYNYDNLGRLATIVRNGVTLSTNTWNSDSSLAKVAYANGAVVNQSYDDSMRLSNRTWSLPSGTYSHSRDVSSGGNLQSESFGAPSGTSAFVYTHDEAGRLSNATVSAGLLATDRSWTWTFDSASNRTTQKITAAGSVVGDYTYSYNSASQLTATTDPAASAGLTWDVNGNATQVGPDTFGYDAANRLVESTDGTMTVNYELDLFGNVVKKIVTGGPSAGTIEYAIGGVLLDASSRPVAQRIDLPGGAQYTAPMGTSVSAKWILTAINGNEFLVTDEVGTPLGSPQVFDPYGQRLTAALPATPGLPSTTWQSATGNETESLATPYQLMGARPYVPALGRFLQPDPKVGGSANLYDFASQDPVNLSDPSGEDVADWAAPLAAAVATMGAIFLFKVSSVSMGLGIGAIIGTLAAGASAALDVVNNNESTWTWVRFGYTVLAGLAAGGGAVAARNRWGAGAKAKRAAEDQRVAQVVAEHTENYGPQPTISTGSNGSIAVSAPREYTDIAARSAYEKAYMQTFSSHPMRNLLTTSNNPALVLEDLHLESTRAANYAVKQLRGVRSEIEIAADKLWASMKNVE